jgi:hypothetical protein
MNRLTIQQAEAEAKWRWGNLFVRGFARYDETLKRPFQVGTICFGSVRIHGQGTSWEGAFSDAARQTNTEASPTSPASATAGRPGRSTTATASGPSAEKR